MADMTQLPEFDSVRIYSQTFVPGLFGYSNLFCSSEYVSCNVYNAIVLSSYPAEQRSETFDLADFEDEREADPPYRAISNYSRLDAQQLDLREGQVVRVIEKHDTGLCWVRPSTFQFMLQVHI